jgi:hypothetical protein
MRFIQNITAFLMTQNHQFEESIRGLNYAKESLDPARFTSPLSNFDRLNIFVDFGITIFSPPWTF